jgi:cell wall-associated NlpC family hydrolase
MKIDIDYAKTFLGKPYVWGGESDKEGGYDCSGFAYNVFKKSEPVKRTTAQGYYDMFKDYEVNKSKVYAGDVLFFGKSKKNITHIAFATSSTEMIESIGTSKNTIKNKGKGVTISKITRRKDLVAVCRFENVLRETLKVAKPTLKLGNRGIEVSNLQKCLNHIGKYNLVTDGIFGRNTHDALCNFQLRYRLSVDGVYGKHSYNKMREIRGGV